MVRLAGAAGAADRVTDLAAQLRERIRRDGNLTVSQYMSAVADAYYASGDVFGRDGDFITAPDISQAFGEIIGLWCVVTWQAMGQPAPFRLVECGPGRGALMRDALRAARAVPSFAAAAEIHLVERSAALRAVQREVLTGHAPRWHDSLASVPAGPLILVGNEFLDALPVRQFVRTAQGWGERMVGLDDNGHFTFAVRMIDAAPVPIALAATAETGAVYEQSDAVAEATAAVAARVARDGGAALFVDYGHRVSSLGETLQAVRGHKYHAVLEDPGTADITAHVDFALVAATARRHGAVVHGPVEQGVWLRRLGIGVRQVQLARGKDPATARAVEQGIRRLTEPHGMGVVFKAMAIAHPSLPALEGFHET